MKTLTDLITESRSKTTSQACGNASMIVGKHVFHVRDASVTMFYVDGKRTSKAKAQALLESIQG